MTTTLTTAQDDPSGESPTAEARARQGAAQPARPAVTAAAHRDRRPLGGTRAKGTLLILAAAAGVAVTGAKGLSQAGWVTAQALCALAAAAAVLPHLKSRRHHDGSALRSLPLMAMGLAVLIAGNLFSNPTHIVTSTFPVHARLGALIGYPLVVYGLVTLRSGRAGRWDFDIFLEATLVPALLVFLSWAQVLRHGAPVPLSTLTFGLARPACDLVIVLVSLRRLAVGDSAVSRVPWCLYAAGGVALLAADASASIGPLGGTAVPGAMLAPLLLIAWVLLAVGCVCAAGEPELGVWVPTRFDAMRLIVVLGALLAGPLLLEAELGTSPHVHGRQLALGAIALSGLAVTLLVRRVEHGSRLEHLALAR